MYIRRKFSYIYFFFLALPCNHSVSEEAFLSMNSRIGCISIITCSWERIPLSTCICAVPRLTPVREPVFLIGLFRSPVWMLLPCIEYCCAYERERQGSSYHASAWFRIMHPLNSIMDSTHLYLHLCFEQLLTTSVRS